MKFDQSPFESYEILGCELRNFLSVFCNFNVMRCGVIHIYVKFAKDETKWEFLVSGVSTKK